MISIDKSQNKHEQGIYERIVKRLLDLSLSIIAIIVLSPIMLIIAILVRLKLGSPIIFTQDRPGLNGEIYRLFKFRSMSNAKDKNGVLLSDKQRLNKFGKRLRSTSLDELPELFNIIKGDMAIVGPRPLLVKYINHYNQHDMRRHEVRPGLTGLAQVSGRNAMSWEKKFEKDVEYVDNVSFSMDLRIVLLTIKRVFSREGIDFVEGHQSIMDYFANH